MIRSNEPPSFSLGIPLNHKEGIKKKCPKLDLKIMTQDDKRVNNPKSIWSKLCWNNTIQVQNLNNKRVEWEMKSHLKEFPIY